MVLGELRCFNRAKTLARHKHEVDASTGVIARKWMIGDGRGSLVGVTDAAGALVERLYLDPWGVRVDISGATISPVRSSGVDVGFTGHEHDEVYGLINMNGRVFDPTMRRFLTQDPIVAVFNTQSASPYSYVQNRPYALVDPTGFQPIPSFEARTNIRYEPPPSDLHVLDGLDGAQSAEERSRAAGGNPLAGGAGLGGSSGAGTWVHPHSGSQSDIQFAYNQGFLHGITGGRHGVDMLVNRDDQSEALALAWGEFIGGSLLFVMDVGATLAGAQALWTLLASVASAGGSMLLSVAEGPAGIIGGYTLLVASVGTMVTAFGLVVAAASEVGLSGLAIANSGLGRLMQLLQDSQNVMSSGGGPRHHVMTNKNSISTRNGGPWTPRFEAMARRAGMTLKEAANTVRVPGHRGPHPQAYHQEIFDRLSSATRGLSGNAYSAAFRAELAALRTEAATVGSTLNRLLVP